MPQPAADRNLLFGILALQMDFIDRDQLVAAMNAWVLDKARPLGEVLVAQGALSAKRLALLEPLVEEHLGQHGNDAQQSLAAVGATARAALAAVSDPELRTTLSRALGEGTPELTSAYQPTPTPCERYVLLRLHARGGLGEVFVARDDELHREVALKQIQARYAHDPVSRARFVVEAEVTGNLEHPGVVPVYGFGTHADGRPYYAMRLVRGESLKDAIARFHQPNPAGGSRSLELRKLLGAFVAVCQAVHYAHSRGVLHRDLKPDNVMLGQFGEVLVVDWGLAKPLDRPAADADRSLAVGPVRPASGSDEARTVAGTALGTPAYMSPEQAAGRLNELTAATDVYSLGATLYCLLTGQAPFQGEAAAVLEQVRKGAFPPPRAANGQAPAALGAVCLKAMALAPQDRYGSARELAEEVERWLADEPVAAHREPVLMRLSRWARRHRPLVAGTAALLLTAVVALGASLVLVGQANRRTQEQRDEAQRQRDLARANFEMARRAVDSYFVQVSESTLLKSPQPGLQPLRKQLLESALKYYQEFLRQGGDDPELKAELAQAHFRVGTITEEIGSRADARLAFQRARDLYAERAAAQPDSPTIRNELARSYRALGRALFDKQPEQAIECFRQSISLGEELAAKHPDDPAFQRDLAWSYNNLAIAYVQIERPEASRRCLEQGITVWKRLLEKHPRPEFRTGLGQAYSNLGWMLTLADRMGESLEATRQAVTQFERAAREDRADIGTQQRLVLALDNLAFQLHFAGQSASAKELYARAMAAITPLVRDNPAVNTLRERLISCHINLGHTLLDTGDDAGAKRNFESAVELARKLPPGAPVYFSHASIHRGLGKLLRKEGKPAAALEEIRKAVQVGEKSPGQKPYSSYELACTRALCCALAGEAEAKQRYADGAMAALRQAAREGWGVVSWMRKDPDLDAIRDRTDFKNLLAELDRPAK